MDTNQQPDEELQQYKENQCERCFKIFPDKTRYLQHKKRKTLCEKDEHKDEPQEKHNCEPCKKEFIRIYDFTRHLGTPKHQKNVDKIISRADKKAKEITSVTVEQILADHRNSTNKPVTTGNKNS